MTQVRNYFSWLAHQLKGWPQQNYYLFWFALGCQIMTLVNSPITPVAVITFIGTTLGVLCVLAINATKAVNGWLGLLSAACFMFVGFTAKNYLSIFEQTAYVLTLDIPVLISVRTWNDDTKDHLKTFAAKEWIISILFTLAVWAASAALIGRFTNDPRPIYDGMAFAISLTGGIVCFLRYNNQYFWWLFSGIAQLILWSVTFAQGDASLGMAINASIYVLNDILAFTVSPWFNAGRKRLGLKEIQSH
ncbi:nicotinamide riboside transporter PnuC [Schleiferilactobacillus harbinensis]|uniref:nicotinamide riboside transporter PnuC n=1 Tax=Schleiferilactobacillus harbinensis TaxID=304207 RepID=UPI00242F19F0|nr:nicotinamide riboside transporter PnuC [Schleiferilactobacillus harbinensis]MCI1686538.1 nicotinamide riboside transporter PnuC [Schleiferilactobacillus harbinensis]MCI1782849.1 nicotinamide riboside transporter PnuC [Schleiferilactobacillus harbinensis]MCI1850776.1 nicotinamide riboside transporter PnuC [Schleiferilactobacillus harbinensis]